jgi:hypothetical protein
LERRHHKHPGTLIATTHWCATHGTLWERGDDPEYSNFHQCSIGTLLEKSLGGRADWTDTNLDGMGQSEHPVGACNAIPVTVVSR